MICQLADSLLEEIGNYITRAKPQSIVRIRNTGNDTFCLYIDPAEKGKSWDCILILEIEFLKGHFLIIFDNKSQKISYSDGPAIREKLREIYNRVKEPSKLCEVTNCDVPPEISVTELFESFKT